MFVLIRMWLDRRRREAVLKMAGYRVCPAAIEGVWSLLNSDNQLVMLNSSRLNLVHYGYERFIKNE